MTIDLDQLAAAFHVPTTIAPEPAKYTPKQLEAMLQHGINLHTRGLTRDAMQIYREVLLHDKNNQRALYFSAIVLSQENKDEEMVLQLMEKAVIGMEKIPEAQYNLGILYHRLGRVQEAQDRFKKAVALMPKLVEAKTSLAGSYLNFGEKDEGLRWLKVAARTQSALNDSVYSRGFAKLTLGDYLGGWEDYDRRWKTASFLVENRRDFGKHARFWNGKPIPGQTLYVHTEQGAGDVIMFSRFLELVAERSRAKTIVLEVGDSLTELLSQLRGVDYVIPSNTPIPQEIGAVQAYLPYMSMMRKVGIFSPARITRPHGWLEARALIDPLANAGIGAAKALGKLNVGVAWAGSKAHKNDRYRTIGWKLLNEHLYSDHRLNGNVNWCSLQVGERARDMDDHKSPLTMCDLTPYMKTFADSAAVIKQLDLLICVDTATIHVGAALKDGPPVWTFIPAAPDWRWGLEGETTPWYSRLTLIRQDRYDDWVTPIHRAADRLATFIQERNT